MPTRLPPRTVRNRLLRRILAVNLLPLVLLLAALLYLDRYQDGLIQAELVSLRTTAQVFAGVIGENARPREEGASPRLQADLARPLLRSLAAPTPGLQARLYALDGTLLADSRVLIGPGGRIEVEPLPPPTAPSFVEALLSRGYDLALRLLPQGVGRNSGRVLDDSGDWASDIGPEVQAALEGRIEPRVRRTQDGRSIAAVGVPVSRNNRVAGAILLRREAREVDQALYEVRVTVLGLFLLVLTLTVGLSFYLARTIARPLLRLAESAAAMREGGGRAGSVGPEILARRDEIGLLAETLDETAHALWARIDSNERFAADVAHEIRNPLTSMRSAIETVRRIEDEGKRQRLLAIINEDVVRLDRLITDIADVSRVDAELSRVPSERVDVAPILSALAEIHEATRSEDGPHIVLLAPRTGLAVLGLEGRLVQVFRNLLSNAVSFSPAQGRITVTGEARGRFVIVAIEDEGPGIPEHRLSHVFERFYSERPQGERFGTHSGLGLSISRQIVEGFRGRIEAENRRGAEGAVLGARFVVRLPRA